MKIILAPDSFKECLSAFEVCRAMERGVRRFLPAAELVSVPLADGGEGTIEALTAASGGTLHSTIVLGPLGESVKAQWGLLGDGKTAVVEAAAAAGLALVPRPKRNPLHTTTFGFGQLIKAALDAGCSRLLLGIGGSATNDCGLGMVQALGVDCHDASGRIKTPITGADLERIVRIDLSGLDPRLSGTIVQAACDVDNPLLGPRGAARTYAPQKGASPEDVERLEAGTAHVIDLVESLCGPVRNLPGAGSAGGLGAALCAFLKARLTPGIDLVLNVCDFDNRLKGADLVLTGEGKIDEQTVSGKTIAGVLRRAVRHGVPVIALAGAALSVDELYSRGLSSLFCICDRPMSLDESIAEAEQLIAQAAERAVRAFAAGRR